MSDIDLIPAGDVTSAVAMTAADGVLVSVNGVTRRVLPNTLASWLTNAEAIAEISDVFSARDVALAAEAGAEAARDEAVSAKNSATSAMNVTLTARDVASNAANTAEDAADRAAASAALADVNDLGFASRADFVSFVAQYGGELPVGLVLHAGGVSYRYTGIGTAIADLPGWVPVAPVAPEHFGAAGDGVTNDSAAFLAALATKQRVLCDGAKTYAVNDVTVAGNEMLDLNGATLVPATSDCRWLVRLNGFDGPQVLNGELRDTSYLTVKTAMTTASAVVGATTISVDSVGGIEAGMVLAVKGNAAGEFSLRKVASASGTSITFSEGLQYGVPSGAMVYAAFGLLSVYSTGSSTFDFKASRLRIRGGGVHLYGHGTAGSDIARGRIEGIYSQSALICQQAILNNYHDNDHILIQSWGDRTLSGSATATGGQTSISVEGLVGTIPVGAVFVAEQVSLKINGVAQSYVSGAPGAGQYTASANGLTLTVPAMTAGASIALSIFDRPFTSYLYDPHGTGTVQGANKHIRCLYIQHHSGVMLENSNNSGGLIHWDQINIDAGSVFNLWIKNTNKFYATHLFAGYSPFPLRINLNDNIEREVNINGLHTRVNTAGHFDAARVAGAEAITVEVASAEAAKSYGRPKVKISSWWGPDFSKSDAFEAVGIGSMSDDPMLSHGNVIMKRPADSASFISYAYSGTLGAPAAVSNNQFIRQDGAYAHDGVDYFPVGNRRIVADQQHSPTQRGTREELRLTKKGETSPSIHTVARYDNSGFARLGLGAGGAEMIWGSGSPEGAVTSAVGSIFMRTDGGAGTTFYVKQSGTGSTGWVAK